MTPKEEKKVGMGGVSVGAVGRADTDTGVVEELGVYASLSGLVLANKTDAADVCVCICMSAKWNPTKGRGYG